jgi:hypothetical protein
MINKEEVAVCISGLARENYKFALKNIHKVFLYDTFYMHWDRGENISVPNCLYVKEPQSEYHNILETRIKPDCRLFNKFTRKPDPPQHRGGKIHWKPGEYQKNKDTAKQILSHYHLVNSLPERYKTIIKIRYDLIVSTRVDFTPYIEMAQEGLVVGFGDNTGGLQGPIPRLDKHAHGDCKKCTGWFLCDHMVFHPRHLLKNVEKLFLEKNLLGSEWGWCQVLCDQWGNKNFINVQGGTLLIKHCVTPREAWYNL